MMWQSYIKGLKGKRILCVIFVRRTCHSRFVYSLTSVCVKHKEIELNTHVIYNGSLTHQYSCLRVTLMLG